eukprot:TRINITY_DN45957_c0_g1_i1.p1 TRINITY_DN45957_c0_g1~~TRINITY_DN45957_c0_g1_i1.p1  ORF type:complete len:291 (-),score=74.80 TRINITY_DN45957_c0_g1_i1:213-1019(-)
MGAGASASVAASVEAASDTEIAEVLKGLSPDVLQKIKAAVSEPAKKNLSNASAMGKWTDKECADMIQGILNQTTKGPPPDVFRKFRPFHLPEYESKFSIGMDAPDGKVFELDGSEKTLLRKMKEMGHGEGKLLVLNLGSYTCPVHRGQVQNVSTVCQEAGVEMLEVYIIDAHPVDEWSGGPIDGVEWSQPKTLEERIKIAKVFQEAKGIKANMVVDDMSNPCNIAYEAVATKACVLEGSKVVWKTGMSPFQYDVDGLKEFLASKKAKS